MPLVGNFTPEVGERRWILVTQIQIVGNERVHEAVHEDDPPLCALHRDRAAGGPRSGREPILECHVTPVDLRHHAMDGDARFRLAEPHGPTRAVATGEVGQPSGMHVVGTEYRPVEQLGGDHEQAVHVDEQVDRADLGHHRRILHPDSREHRDAEAGRLRPHGSAGRPRPAKAATTSCPAATNPRITRCPPLRRRR